MIIYWTIFVFAIVVVSFQSSNKAKISVETSDYITIGQRSFLQIIICLTPTIFFLGLRTKVADSIGYYESFKHLPSEFSIEGLDQRAVGFALIRQFCKSFLFSSPEAWLTFMVLISVIPIAAVLAHYSEDTRISLFVFFASTEFTFLLNGARQFAAVCICFYAFKYLVNNKPIQYFVLIALGISFHLTAIVMIPAYFIVRTKPWSKKMICVVVIGAFLSVYSESVFSVFNDQVLSESVYSHYATSFFNSRGVSLPRTLMQCVPAIFAFWKRSEIQELDNRSIDYCVNLSILNSLVFVFASTIGGNLSGRVAEYFTIFNLILYPVLLNKTLTNSEKRIIKPIFYFLFLVFFFYQMQIAWDGLPYVSLFLKLDL